MVGKGKQVIDQINEDVVTRLTGVANQLDVLTRRCSCWSEYSR